MTRAVAALRLLRRAFHARAVAAHDDGRLEAARAWQQAAGDVAALIRYLTDRRAP